MTRFSIKKDSNIKVAAFSGREIKDTANRDFATVAECILWAKKSAQQAGYNLTEVQITDTANEVCASYSPAGKRIG